MLTEEQKVAMRRKAQQDTAAFAPEEKEMANYWAREILRQTAYMFGGISEACQHWTSEERVDAAGRVHELISRDPAPVLTIVQNDVA